FATSVIPGWHTTIFPPYFVAGAIFSGFAMVQTLLIITRKILHLEEYITLGHIEAMNKVIILTGGIVAIAYSTEFFIAWYSGSFGEGGAFWWRVNGPYWWAWWCLITCNVICPQMLWFKKLRRNIAFTFFMSIIINIGMWFERFVIIVLSLYHDWIPSSWTYFRPTWADIGFYVGTFGLFFTCYFIFAKYFPVIAIHEIKHVLRTSGESYKENMDGIEEKSNEEFYQEISSHSGHGHA
ncbi:MAG TPA: NrfD/PsrC family molybdoenzyme membrane anchor subunit, partial [Chitinophagaceae bacterium]|nr:NrfD/PsrC family molybdoenzyme membrane anchor subunit [Chitinophagaceae bacterium]